MREIAKRGAVMALVAAGLNLVPAGAADAQAVGFLCGFTSVGSNTLIDGGPLVADERTGVTISMTCTLQHGANSTHAGADTASASSLFLPQAVVLPPTFVTFRPPAGAPIFICTQMKINSTTYYHDDSTSSWSTSTSVPCKPYRLGGDIGEEVDRILVEEVDPVLCPVLSLVFPPEGDIPLLWDCPPYGNN